MANLSDGMIAEIKALRAQGLGPKAIAARTGLSRSTVKYRMDHVPGVKFGTTWSREHTGRLREMFVAGAPYSQMAAELGRSIDAIRGKIHDMREEWDLPSRRPPPQNKPKAFEPLAAADHDKHLRKIRKGHGCGFPVWPDELMERVYLIEKWPPQGREFWRAA